VGSKPGQPWETDQRTVFRVRFGEDAAAYDRTRPVAPDAVFDEIVRLAGWAPGSAVVEIGPGTGQATRQLARRGLRIVAIEIDPRLAARARENLAGFPEVEVVTTSFEEWIAGDSVFDGVIACNSFHWLDPDTRFQDAAALLRPGGCLVVAATPVVVPDDAARFWWDVQDDWAAVGAERVDPSDAHPDLVEDAAPAVRSTGLFEEPVVIRRRFDVALTAEEYATNLSTQSGVKELPVEAQGELTERIRRRVEGQGGRVTLHHVAVATVAKRSG
jgi:SAM-dependent methyltransferase